MWSLSEYCCKLTFYYGQVISASLSNVSLKQSTQGSLIFASYRKIQFETSEICVGKGGRVWRQTWLMAEVSRWLWVSPNSGTTSGISSSPSNITRNVTFTGCQTTLTHSSALKRDKTSKSIIPALAFTLLDSGPKLITLTNNYTDCSRLSFTTGISYAKCRALCSQQLLWIPLILEFILVATARGGRAHIKREKVKMDVSARSTSQRYGLRHLFITDSFSCCFVI